jgi:MFS family permease
MTASTEAATLAYPSAARAWSLVGVFFFTAILSVIDRGIITLLVDPMRRDLSISDVQISLLQGLSFGLFYAVVGLPLGLTADRLSRRRLLIFGIVMWSLGTIFGGFAANYTQLFASRLLVGLGEATLSPCAISMICDSFLPKRRGTAIGVYLMGQAVAGGAAIFLTGLILAVTPSGIFDRVPILAGLAPWRITFVLCGLAGFVAVALLTVSREPARRGLLMNARQGLGIAPVAGYLARQWRVFAPFYMGAAVISISIFSVSAWNASLLIRGFGASPAQVGRWLGPVSMIAGVCGALAGGQAVDFAARRNWRGGSFLILMSLCWLAMPAALAVLAPAAQTAVFLLAFAVAVAPTVGVALNAASQAMTPGNMRGVAVALLGFTNTIIGLTLGPLLVALANQHLFKTPRMVGYSIMVVAIPAEVLACVLFGLGYRAMKTAAAAGGEFAAVLEAGIH